MKCKKCGVEIEPFDFCRPCEWGKSGGVDQSDYLPTVPPPPQAPETRGEEEEMAWKYTKGVLPSITGLEYYQGDHSRSMTHNAALWGLREGRRLEREGWLPISAEQIDRIAALEQRLRTDLDTKIGKPFEAATEFLYQRKIAELERELKAEHDRFLAALDDAALVREATAKSFRAECARLREALERIFDASTIVGNMRRFSLQDCICFAREALAPVQKGEKQ